MTEALRQVVKAMCEEFVRQAREAGSGYASPIVIRPHEMTLDGLFDLEKVARAAVQAVIDAAPHSYAITGVVGKGANMNTGDRVGLYWSAEGGGWWQWGPEEWRKEFATRAEAEQLVAVNVGPWFSKPDPQTVEIVEVRPAAKLKPMVDALTEILK